MHIQWSVTLPGNYHFLFNCFNAGLVELLMESDTLRKIQIKHGHGLAGSFKDRPIAEWLQLHNPTEMDYQKVGFNYPVIQTEWLYTN